MRATAARKPLWRRGTGIGLAFALAMPALFITAQAAEASWLPQSTPPVSGASTWELTGVSCVSPNVCMAVGDTSGTSSQLLAERKDRGPWSALTIPDPAPGSQLGGVSCPSVKFCVAVGVEPVGAGSLPLAEVWRGTSWAGQLVPAPAGAVDSSLSSVSCTSATRCIAVGVKTKGSRSTPLAVRWDGAKWRVQAPPSPAKATGGEFDGVSCTSATRCVAVGDSTKGTRESALAELWNGASWKIQATPNLAPDQHTQLDSVSCASASACMAGGDGLAEHWNGKKWSLEKIASPHGNTPASLVGVSCVRAGVCYAVGSFFADGVLTRTAQFWNGSKWSNTTVPINTSQDSSSLSGVSCTTQQDCTAVGSYHDPVNGDRALAEDFELRWQDQSPEPLGGVISTGLSAVSCTGPRACVAVGTFETNSSVFESFTEVWDGSEWLVKVTPRPKVSNLAGISCTGPRSCQAVGDVLVAGILQPLALIWNGIAWASERVPLPAGAVRGFLNDVSCSSPSACTAVGQSAGKKGKQITLAERWNGKKWAVQPTPSPAGATDVVLRFVSCGSGAACVAVGGSSLGRLLEQWDGKVWKVRTAPLPKGGSGGFLNGVSCTSATACTLVGAYQAKSRLVPLADRWNGKSWKPQAVPPKTSSFGLNGVSCVAAASCFAIGFTGAQATFGQHWNGRRWTVPQPMQVPVGAQSTELSGLSCTSSTSCMVAGSYLDSTSIEQMLAEQYS